MDFDVVFSGLICGVGLAISGAYFLGRLRHDPLPAGWWVRWETPDGIRRREHRRDLGMAIVALISVATFLGIHFINPARFPVEFGSYWICVGLLLLWLCGLALADLRQTLQLLARHRRSRWGARVEHRPPPPVGPGS